MNNPPDHLRQGYGGQEGGSHAAPLLVIDGVQAGYGDFKALFNITLHVDVGEIVTLLGANGAGKTTTLRVISGLVHPTKGAVHFDGKNISTLSPHEIVELGISHVPEGRQLFPHMSVEENLALGAYIARARQRLKQTMEEQFTLFPLLKERRKQLAGTLSGGEQQMVAIARGLMTQPKLLMLDEPSLGLAPKIVEEVFAKVQQIGERGLTVLIVEQNVVDALSISSRGYVVENGAVDPGLGTSATDLLRNERLRSAYLGL
jgi:branched-chain amino acid transport system ATP-binding protein